MAAEKINLRKVATGSGNVRAVVAPLARQTYIAQNVPLQARGVAYQIAGNVPAILARNARSTHIQAS